MASLLSFIGSLLDPRSTEAAQSEGEPTATDPQLHGIKHSMTRLLDDCDTPEGHVARRVRLARNIEDLWLLRTDAYHQIARVHGEPAAKARINSLIPQLQGRVRGVLVRPI